MLQRKQYLETARRGRIRRISELRKHDALRKSLESRIFSKVRAFLRKFGNTQSFLYREFGLFEPGVASVQLTEELFPLMDEHYRRCFVAVFKMNNEAYGLGKKQEEVEIFGRQIDIERFVASYFATRQLLLSNVSNRVARRIDKVIRDGRLADKNLQEISRDVAKVVAGLAPARAALIARTETHSAVSAANHLYYGQLQKDYDIKMMKTWVSTADERTRVEHRNANGQTVEMSEPFIIADPKLGTVNMQHVADPAGGAYHSVNCRCVIVYADERDVVLN